ncbi:ATP-binding protein [Haliangium sp.]|uniref:ATP-binding protein n=1 Tax=Haliangium sp. TaxID=2663208 RepID=UPI003D11CE8F
MTSPTDRIDIQVDVAREIREISNDFAQPIELLREVLSNSYDAGAREVVIRARPELDPSRRRILNVDVQDDGLGMDRETLGYFFGLGFNRKPTIPDRPPIGAKGHGTKIYYNATELWVATRTKDGPLLVTHADQVRVQVSNGKLPELHVRQGDDAHAYAESHQLPIPDRQGTCIRLIDFTPDSGRLIDDFTRTNLENYIRWFTIYGSFAHAVRGSAPDPPMHLRLQATDENEPSPVAFGHPWPEADITDLRTLKKGDSRRPFNHFRKRFHVLDRPISEGYRIDIAVLFEGKRARMDRDPCIRRQRAGGLYFEEQRYGFWLCKNYIPVEKAEPLSMDDIGPFAVLEPHRALILANCDDFELTANRGSVGNSQATLLEGVRQGVVDYLREIEDDSDLRRFLDEYEEDRISRLREKDHKAFRSRLKRYNNKKLCRVTLPDGKPFEFYEPQREITLYGLLSQLQILDSGLIPLDVLDYDDHRGIDLLVRRGTSPGDLLARDQVAYVELKYVLESRINHAFAHLHAIVCWESDVGDGDKVSDPTGESFDVRESHVGDVTHTSLMPPPDSKFDHQVRVIVLKRLMQQSRGYNELKNPRPVKNGGGRS